MIVWKTAKRWVYKGRTCEIQRTSVGGATQYRGLVEVGTEVSDRALDAAPVGNPKRKHRPERHAEGEYRTWLYFAWPGEDVPTLREAVDELADHVDETAT